MPLSTIDMKQIPDGVQRITNIATLRGVTPSSTRAINLLGYYSSGDGGGGEFYGDIGRAPGYWVDNGGTIIVPTGGDGSTAWIRIIDGSVNVRWFGAKGDGSTDDTAAIQATVNCGNKFIFIPTGTYKTTSAISIPVGVTLSGAGSTSKVSVYGAHGFTIAGAQDGVGITSILMESFSSLGVADPRTYDAIQMNGAFGNAVNYALVRDVFLQGWNTCINAKYTWLSSFERVSTVNSNYGIVLFGQSVNNSIDNCNLTVNSGNASLYLLADGAHIGEGLNVSNSLLSSGQYGVQSTNGFLSLGISNCTLDLITDTAIKGVDIRDFKCVGNWIYATNKGISFAALGSIIDENGALIGNTITVTSSTGRGIEILGANSGINVIGGSISVTGTAQGVYVDGQNCFIGGVYFINPGSGASIYLNTTVGNKIGSCTGTVSIVGGFQTPDYSEGSWTPVVSSDGLGVTTFTATSAIGKYIKNGRMVVATCVYAYSDRGSVGNSYGYINLPFAAANDSVPSLASVQIEQSSFDTKGYQLMVLPNTSTAAFRYDNGGGTLYAGGTYMVGNSFPASGTIRVTITYFSAT